VNDPITPQHLSPETVEDYFRAGVPAGFTLSAELRARLEIDPPHHELRLICPATGATPDVTAFERIEIERTAIVGEQGEWFILRVRADRMHYEAYVLIESIVDQLRSGASFRHSVSESVAGLKGLLASRKRLTDEKEAGLIGELLLLRHLIVSEGEDAAVQSWLGPLSEEHDFGFETIDAEVKTTRSEGRIHQIGSENQLQPTGDRPLYLVSIQITLAGQAENAFTLGDLISSVRQHLERTRRTFDSALERLGWVDADADLYRSRFQLRAEPRAYLVDADFPAITGARLDSAVPQRHLVSSVSYRVDVAKLPHATAPHPIRDFCEVAR